MRLTKDEIILVAVILIALAVGATVRHYRQTHPPANLVPKPTLEQRALGKSRLQIIAASVARTANCISPKPETKFEAIRLF
jgi:hypothetical protein